ncbi:hypothetical protein Hanom_Chr09g00831031 [Helianthus anomalus]
MSSERCNSTKCCLSLSSQVNLGQPLLLLPSTVMVSTALTGSATASSSHAQTISISPLLTCLIY